MDDSLLDLGNIVYASGQLRESHSPAESTSAFWLPISLGNRVRFTNASA